MEKVGVEGQMFEYIYVDGPLGFEKDPIASTSKMQPYDPLEEVNIGEGTDRWPTCISANIDPILKNQGN